MTRSEAKLMNEHGHAISNAKGWLETIIGLVQKRRAAMEADDTEAMEEVDREIAEAPLSVLIRDNWHQPGADRSDSDQVYPVEYEILLTTGGPALRIYGRLDNYNQPDEWPLLQWQDWGVEWTTLPDGHEHRDELQAFANSFYYGDY